jgi:hypothetical protein
VSRNLEILGGFNDIDNSDTIAGADAQENVLPRGPHQIFQYGAGYVFQINPGIDSVRQFEKSHAQGVAPGLVISDYCADSFESLCDPMHRAFPDAKFPGQIADRQTVVPPGHEIEDLESLFYTWRLIYHSSPR